VITKSLTVAMLFTLVIVAGGSGTWFRPKKPAGLAQNVACIERGGGGNSASEAPLFLSPSLYDFLSAQARSWLGAL